MKVDPVTVSPSTPTLEAIEIMRAHKLGCLPVVEEGTLVGILTAHDFLEVSRKLFEDRMAMLPNEKSQPAKSLQISSGSKS
jgi:CBS domain-containing protein